MDEALIEPGHRAPPAPPEAPGMPPETPGRMPSQRLSAIEAPPRHAPGLGRRAARRRALVFPAAALLAGFTVNEMLRALSVDHLTPVSVVVLVLFAVNISWISVPFVSALAGLVRSLRERPAPAPDPRPLSSRTALVMPTHNEDPARVAAALEAMARALVAAGAGRAFEIFLLSDTTRGEVALAEEAVVGALRRRLGGAIGVHYRRRAENTAHKSGNLRDFCERWGSAYDHLLLLDADSLMDGATLIALARRMEDDPDAGLIQTLPRLHRGVTLLARVQQFAGVLYGTLLGRGLAWWTGNEGSFWGHNAILRTQAFMSCAGLPVLPGAPPFGGPILSHDFVEAALIRRGGWGVSIADDLPGSYEECPSSIADLAVRDRRWCQGNFQHARVLTAKGLHWVSRLHLVNGIMSYLSSPFWLLFVLSSLALGLQYEVDRQRYFAHTSTLFPLWPRIDPARAIRLFGLTLGILLGPKLMGLLAALSGGRRRRGYGGAGRLGAGFLLEVVLSALVAPIQGLIHCGVVADVLRGRDSGWGAQRREGGGLSWREVLSRHRWHVAMGAALALAAWAISWQMLAWLTPAVVGMLLAPPLSKLMASPGVGRWVMRRRLLGTPEEVDVPEVARAAAALTPAYRAAVAGAPGLAEVVADPALLRRHLALTDRGPARPRGQVAVVEALAERKIRDARSVEEAVSFLSPVEQARVLARPSLLRLLARRGQGQVGERAQAARPAPAPAVAEGDGALQPV